MCIKHTESEYELSIDNDSLSRIFKLQEECFSTDTGSSMYNENTIHITMENSLKNHHSLQVDRWLRSIELDENGFLSEENFDEGVRRTRINTDLYVRLVAKDHSFRCMGLNTFKSIVREDSQYV